MKRLRGWTSKRGRHTTKRRLLILPRTYLVTYSFNRGLKKRIDSITRRISEIESDNLKMDDQHDPKVYELWFYKLLISYPTYNILSGRVQNLMFVVLDNSNNNLLIKPFIQNSY